MLLNFSTQGGRCLVYRQKLSPQLSLRPAPDFQLVRQNRLTPLRGKLRHFRKPELREQQEFYRFDPVEANP